MVSTRNNSVYFVILSAALTTFIPSVMTAKVLVMYPFNAKSHLHSIKPFIVIMLSAGHAVTVLHAGVSEKGEKIGNASIEVWKLSNVTDNIELLNYIIWNSNDHSDKHIEYLNLMEIHFDEHMRQTPEKITKLLAQNWDLIVCDGLFTIHGFAIAQLLKHTRNVPYIIYDTTFVFQYQASALAFGGSWSSQARLWSYFPRDTDDVYKPNEIRSRFLNFLEVLVEEVTMNWILQLYAYKGINKFTVRPFTMPRFMRDSSLLITDEIRGFGQVTSRASRVQVFSAFCSPSTSMASNLTEFVEDKFSKGCFFCLTMSLHESTIYIAFGTMVKFTHAAPHLRDSFFDALDALIDYRIVFATRGQTLRSFKSHVKVVEWAPQVALLRHPKTKLFISHGGLKSFKEAVCAKCPVVVLPFFAEQGRNAMVIAKNELGTVLNKFLLEKNLILRELLKVLEDNRYARNIRRLHNTFLDNPIPAKEEVISTISRIIKRRGNRLRHEHRAESLCSVHLYCIDLFILLIFISMIVSFQ